MMVGCGMTVKKMGVLEECVWNNTALTVKMETVTLVVKGRWSLTCFVY
jgi:hypothetical protein